MELMVTLSILTTISAIVLSSLSSNVDREALHKNTDAVASVFAEARSLTTSSKDASNFGVHLESAGPTLFKGTVYSAGASSNVPLLINSRVRITAISLLGGGNDVVFSKLSGNTAQTGSFRVSLVADATQYKTITIYKTGVVEVQ